MKLSTKGYKKNSPDRNEPKLRIKGSSITMQDVEHPVLAVDSNGRTVLMMPNQDYEFGGAKYVDEYPLRQQGGQQLTRQYIDSTLNANKHLDWVQRLFEKNPKSIQIPGQPGRSTHFMASGNNRVYPTVVNLDGKLQYLGDNAYDYADSTGQYIEFPTDEQAQQFGEQYKQGTGVLKNFVPMKKQQGGPIIVTDPNDPRLRAYNDSLTLYQDGLKDDEWLKNAPRVRPGVVDAYAWNNFEKGSKGHGDAYRRLTKLNKEEPSSLKNQVPFNMSFFSDGDSKLKTFYTRYNKPTQPVVLDKKSEPTGIMKLLQKQAALQEPEPEITPAQKTYRPVTPEGDSKIVNTPYGYNIKQYRDTTGKITREEYYDQEGKQIEMKQQGGSIKIKKSHEGLFTKEASSAGYGVQEFANHILANKDHYSPEVVKRASFAHNAAGWKQTGGEMSPQDWYSQNMKAGYKPAPAYKGDPKSWADAGNYLQFYDPNQYTMGKDSVFTNNQNPDLKKGMPGYNPFISYTPPVIPTHDVKVRPGKQIFESNRTPVSFGNNSTTYKYADGRMATYDAEGKEIQPITNSYQFGGSKLKPSRTDNQGTSTQMFVEARNATFMDYLADNMKRHMYRMGGENCYQAGGQNEPGIFDYKNEMGSDVENQGQQQQQPQLEHPLGAPEGISDFRTSGPFGLYGTGVNPTPQHPDTNSTAMQQFVETPQGNAGMSFGDQLKTDPQTLDTAATTTAQTQTNVGIDPIGIMKMFNMTMNQAQSNQQQQKLDQWQSIENVAPHMRGSRGDYTSNQGFFRPDSNTPAFKSGGEKKYEKNSSHVLTHQEIQEAIRNGYTLEFE